MSGWQIDIYRNGVLQRGPLNAGGVAFYMQYYVTGCGTIVPTNPNTSPPTYNHAPGDIWEARYYVSRDVQVHY